MMRHTLVLDQLRPAARVHAVAFDLGLVLCGSLLTALAAQLSFPLPWTPVPITAQTFAVLLVGALLGARRGALSMCAYLAEGAVGLPVFAEWRAGFPVLLGPTGGYLFGFVLAAGLIGWFAERGFDRRFGSCLLVMALGNVLLFAVGLLRLAAFVPPPHLWNAGLWPFLPGAVVKTVLAALLLPAGWKLLGIHDRAR